MRTNYYFIWTGYELRVFQSPEDAWEEMNDIAVNFRKGEREEVREFEVDFSRLTVEGGVPNWEDIDGFVAEDIANRDQKIKEDELREYKRLKEKYG